MTEDKMIGKYHQLNGHEFEQTLGDGEGQRSLVCSIPWSRRVRHDLATEQQKEVTGELPRWWLHHCGLDKTDVEAETPILWPSDTMNSLI